MNIYRKIFINKTNHIMNLRFYAFLALLMVSCSWAFA